MKDIGWIGNEENNKSGSSTPTSQKKTFTPFDYDSATLPCNFSITLHF